MGIDTLAFRKECMSTNTQMVLDACRSEGIALGVKTTPAIFINRVAYHNYKDPQWVIDAIEYAYEKHTHKKQKSLSR